jgi:hypothetical protein
MTSKFVFVATGPVSRLTRNYGTGLKMGLNNSIKIRFIGEGELSIDATIARSPVTGDSRCRGTKHEMSGSVVPE